MATAVRRAVLVRLAVALAVAVAGGVWPAGRASADQVLNPGQVVSLDPAQPGVVVLPISDGRLRGIGFAATVVGVGFVNHAGAGEEAVTAAPGAELCVFGVTMTVDSQKYLSQDTGEDVTATLIEAGTRVPLNSLSLEPLGDVRAVSVPTGAPVLLELAKAGFAQTLDLRTGRRTGSTPLALYRDPDRAHVTVSLRAGQTITGTNPADGTAVSFRFGLDSVDLSYFSLDPSVLPPASDRAFLVAFLSAEAVPGSGPTLELNNGRWPADHLQLVLPDGTRIPALHRDDSFEPVGPYAGYYWFPVPADMTTARLQIQPASIAGVETPPNSFDHTVVTVGFAQPISFDISLPAPPSQAVPQPRPVTPTARHTGGGSNLSVVVAAVVIVLAGVGLTIFLRRQRRPLALPAGTPVRALPPPPRPLALPPGPAIASASRDGSEPSADIAPAPVAPAAAPANLVVRLLGPIEVDGLRRPIRRPQLSRFLLFLAANSERVVTTDEIRTALGKNDDHPIEETTVHSYAKNLRKALPEGALPDAGKTGYRLSDTTEVDWARFEQFINAAERSAADRIANQRQGLALVRGQPFKAAVWHGVDEHCSQMDAAIEKVANALAVACLDAGDPAGAEWACAQGVLGVPGSVQLWQHRHDAALAGSGVSPKWVREAARRAGGRMPRSSTSSASREALESRSPWLAPPWLSMTATFR